MTNETTAEARCPECGEPVRAIDDQCPACGADLDDDFERQAELDRHNAEYDRWARMSDRERWNAIKWAMQHA